MYIYVNVYVYAYVNVNIHVSVCVHIHVCICTCIYVNIPTSPRAFLSRGSPPEHVIFRVRRTQRSLYIDSGYSAGLMDTIGPVADKFQGIQRRFSKVFKGEYILR